MKFSFAYLIFAFLVLFSVAPLALAATQTTGGDTSQTQTTGTDTTGQGSVTLLNPLGAGTSLNQLIADVLQIVVQVGSIVVILMLVYVGFKFVTAHGEPGEISEARTSLMWTIVGALILLGAEAIAKGIQATVQALSTGN